jgi:hypothetical protein
MLPSHEPSYAAIIATALAAASKPSSRKGNDATATAADTTAMHDTHKSAQT